MISINDAAPQDAATHVLNSARRKGVRLWQEQGRLRYTAPKGALSAIDLRELQAFKPQIIALLERVGNEATQPGRVEGHLGVTHVPLTYTQRADWGFVQLGQLRRMRQIASATLLEGELSPKTFEASVLELVRRHAALRTRIVLQDAIPLQEVQPPGELPLDIRCVSYSGELSGSEEIGRLIENTILAPVPEIEAAPWSLRLVQLEPQQHVLIVAMDHMISDAYSMGLFLKELFAAYVQSISGQGVHFPAIPVQFPDHALQQEQTRAAWEQEHLGYWTQRLRSATRLKFPHAVQPPASKESGWSGVPIRIDRETRKALLKWSRQARTTLVMSAFTAYIAAVLLWCEASDAVVQFQTSGRFDGRLTRTLGYFASVLHLRIGLGTTDTFTALLEKTTREYCTAFLHADFSYLSAQVPRPDITRSTMFNWVPDSDQVGPTEWSAGRLRTSPYVFDNPALKYFGFDRDPVVQLFDDGAEVAGGVFFPLSDFTVDTMEAFARYFIEVLRRMLANPQDRVRSTYGNDM